MDRVAADDLILTSVKVAGELGKFIREAIALVLGTHYSGTTLRESNCPDAENKRTRDDN